ncbi:MAG: S1C family serine protease [Erysipelotrichaceae bacterium]|nr:S1C family serine protease [Erysipelotrichaceae bacterium]
MKNNSIVIILLVVIMIWLSAVTFSMNQKKETAENENINEYNVSGFSTDFTKIIDEVKSSVVSVNADNTISSGFVYKQIDDKVYVITAYHGVSEANYINVCFDSEYICQGNVIGFDAFNDLAVIELTVPYEIQAIKIGDASLLKTGEFVLNIGTPNSLEYHNSVELGMVSNNIVTIENQIKYEEQQYSYDMDLIVLSNNLKEGYSGSPVFNMAGEVVGMILMKEDSDISYALTINEARLIAEKLIAGEDVNKLNLGIKGTFVKNLQNYEKSYLNLNVEIIDGLFANKVNENSLASLAGVKANDVIVAINGVEMNDINEYLNILYSGETSYKFDLIRDNEKYEIVGNLND